MPKASPDIRVVFDSLNPDYEIGDDATKSAEGATQHSPGRRPRSGWSPGLEQRERKP